VEKLPISFPFFAHGELEVIVVDGESRSLAVRYKEYGATGRAR
jgi:hypothetical protein